MALQFHFGYLSKENDNQFSSVQFSCSVVSNSLRPHESQHARPPCPSPTPRVHPDSRTCSEQLHHQLIPESLLVYLPSSLSTERFLIWSHSNSFPSTFTQRGSCIFSPSLTHSYFLKSFSDPEGSLLPASHSH